MRHGVSKIWNGQRDQSIEGWKRQQREIARRGGQPTPVTNEPEAENAEPPKDNAVMMTRRKAVPSRRRRRERSSSKAGEQKPPLESRSSTRADHTIERPPSSRSNRTASIQSGSESEEEEVNTFEELIHNVATHIAEPVSFEDAVKKGDTDKALEIIFTELRDIKRTILTAASKHATDRASYKAVRDASGVKGALKLLLNKLESESEEVRRHKDIARKYSDVRRVLANSELDIPFLDMDKRLKAEGAKGGLELLLQYYHRKQTSEQQLRLLEEKIRHAFPSDTEPSHIEEAFREGGPVRGFEYLKNCYLRYEGRSAGLELVERRLTVTRDLLLNDGRQVKIDGLPPDKALKHLVSNLQDWVRTRGEELQTLKNELGTEKARHLSSQTERSTLERLNASFKTKQDQHESETKTLKEKHKTDISVLNKQWEEVWEQEKRNAKTLEESSKKAQDEAVAQKEMDMRHEVEQANARTEKLKETHKADLRAKDIALSNERSSASRQAQAVRQAHQEELARKNAELATQRDAAAKQERTLQDAQRTELSRRDTVHQQEVSRVNGRLTSAKAEHKNREDELRRINAAAKYDAEEKERKLKQRHQDEMASKQTAHLVELRLRDDTLTQTRIAHQDAMNKARNEMEIQKAQLMQQIAEMEEKFNRREVEMRREDRGEIEALRGALVAREHSKGLSDPEIWTRFKDVAAEVDRLSRIVWDKRRESGWPLSESNLRRSGNQRKLKQHIVQSSIWIILYEQIFYSPFQIFAQEGQAIHHEWTGYFGEGKQAVQ